MKIKKMGMLFLAVLLMLSVLCGYSSLDEKVFDDAGLLDSSQEQELQGIIADLAEQMSLDIVIVTTSDAGGKSAGSYADDFYDDHGFGYERTNGSGILYLIDMDNREFYISAAGVAQEMYTDRDIDDMLDDITPYMKKGDYYGACREFLRGVKEYGTNSEVAQNGYYDAATDTFVEYTAAEWRARQREAKLKKVFSAGSILWRLAAGLAVGGVAVLIMAVNVRSQKAPGGRVYLRPGSEKVRQRYDHKTNTTVSTRQIPKNNGGSGGGGGGGGHTSSHTSSGGHSHSGGGRSF